MQENTYIVSKNDNLYDIAKNNNTTIGILKALNNLESNILQIGQILKLPSSNVEDKKPIKYIIYTVKTGDNLYSIANSYNLSLEELINFNEQATTLIKPGQEILIPKKSNNLNLTYITKPGDTLYNIAKRFNVSIDNLQELNNLNTNLLKIGQTIIIPETMNYQTYVVRSNDTLESIANKFNTTINNLKRINNLSTNDISVGQIILIP